MKKKKINKIMKMMRKLVYIVFYFLKIDKRKKK